MINSLISKDFIQCFVLRMFHPFPHSINSPIIILKPHESNEIQTTSVVVKDYRHFKSIAPACDWGVEDL